MGDNPYSRLRRKFDSFYDSVRNAPKTQAFFWKGDSLVPDRGYRLDQVFQRAIAAKSMGYEMVISAEESGMIIYYRKLPNWSLLL